MKRYHVLSVMLFSALIGCVSMPDPVNEAYLVNQTKDDEKIFKVLEEKVVSKKLELDNYKETIKNAERKVQLGRSELSVLNKKKSLLDEEKRLAGLKEDSAAENDLAAQLEKNDHAMQKQRLKLRFLDLSLENARTLGKIRESELAVLVGELNYEKAKVAKRYQDKRMKDLGKDKEEPSFFAKIFGSSGDEAIDPGRYNAYWNRLLEGLRKERDHQKDIETKMVEAEKAYESFTAP
ncbi:MAG: hypothetical protein JXA20_18730 [Spirochaetes bacterium]|nr:hypothetical protein [Spirochaetota bacterium]